MTLKQFLKLAGGLILAFVIYHSNLVFLIKWPLVIGISSLGAALAFLPVNEQPLEKWIFTFFHSVYSPTIYIWQKQLHKFDFEDRQFQQEPSTPKVSDTEEKEPKLEEFLATLDEKEEVKDQKTELETKKEKSEVEEKPKKVTPPQPKEELDFDFSPQKLEATAEAKFGEIPRPQTPSTPNKIIGMVFTQEGKLIENAIIEIQDKSGHAVRALRTNKLGQFETATPLSSGEYLVTVEKEGYDFDILKLEAKGEVIEPLIIKAKNGNGNG
jgi:hypothetical protein